MICALCKCEIDQDFLYCDMCGEEVKTCPVCKKPGKGKVCTTCGKPLVLAKSQDDAETTSNDSMSNKSVGIASESTPTAGGTYRLPDTESNKPAFPQLRLLNKNIDVDFEVDNNSIIGRTAGQYVAIFSAYSEISGKHCRFNYDAAQGWCVTDLGSKFKTRYNNQELLPNVPQPLSDEGYLKIANIEFFVRILPG